MKLNLGIRAHDLPGAPFETIDDFISSFKRYDLDYIQLVYKKAFKDFKMDPHFLLELADKLKESDIKVAMIGAYFNMIHPDLEKRHDGFEYFEWCMETAKVFDTLFVGSETGSANGDKWTYNEYNHTQEAYELVKDTVAKLCHYGKGFKARPLIEGAYAHTIYCPDLMNRLLEETELSDITVDVYNYLNIDNHEKADAIFDRCLKLFGDKIRVFHVKDYNVSDSKLVQCGISKGIMNWNYYVSRIKKENKGAVMILEGVTGEDIETSIRYLRSLENA